jgi:hypothetical protein
MLYRYFKVCRSRVSMTHPEFFLEKTRIYICTYANHWISVFLQIPTPMWAYWGPPLKQKMYRYDQFAFMWILETLEAKIWQQYTTSCPLLSSPDQTFRLPWIEWVDDHELNKSWLFVLVITYINGTKEIQCSHIHISDSSQKLYFVVCVYILRESANDMTRSTTIADINCLTSHMDIMPLLISKCPNWTHSHFRSRAWWWWNPGHAHKKLQRDWQHAQPFPSLSRDARLYLLWK